MSILEISAILLAVMMLLLMGGVWIAITLALVGFLGLTVFSSTPAGKSLFTAFWGANASWELAALPMFIWMGEILFRTKLSEQMFEGLAPWLNRVPGRLMHTTILGCGIFGSVSGSSAATCATIAKVALPELIKRGYNERIALGSLATATECAAYGVLGSLAIALQSRMLTWANFRDSLMGATRVSCMIMFILAGAKYLSLTMAFTGIPRELAEWVASLHLAPFALIGMLAVLYILLGTALDGISMIVLTSTVVMPMIIKAGFDVVWFGIFIVLLVEIAEVTPPVGFNLFVLQNMTGKDSNTIARASLPFFACLIVCIGIITVFPQTVMWLPDYVMGVAK